MLARNSRSASTVVTTLSTLAIVRCTRPKQASQSLCLKKPGKEVLASSRIFCPALESSFPLETASGGATANRIWPHAPGPCAYLTQYRVMRRSPFLISLPSATSNERARPKSTLEPDFPITSPLLKPGFSALAALSAVSFCLATSSGEARRRLRPTAPRRAVGAAAAAARGPRGRPLPRPEDTPAPRE